MVSAVSDQPMDLDNEVKKAETNNVEQKMWRERKRICSVNLHRDATMQHAENPQQLDGV